VDKAAPQARPILAHTGPKDRAAKADRPRMEAFLTTLAYGVAALFGVAVLVAAWEYWLSRRLLRAPEPAPASPCAAHVDVDVSALQAQAPENEQTLRQNTVDVALHRMARPAAATSSANSFWIETRPMVGPGAMTEVEPH
jgi:hypothetical protein